MIYFDLETEYSVEYIARLLGLSKKMALRYTSKQGKLTERGLKTLQRFNQDLMKLYGF